MLPPSPLPISILNEPTRQELSTEEAQVYSADPASFLVANSIVAKLRESVSELKTLLCKSKPDLEVVLDKVTTKMVNLGFINIFGDRIVLLKSRPHMEFDKSGGFEFMPRLCSIVAQRILNSAKAKTLAPGEQIHWSCLPNDPRVLKRLREINRRYQTEIDDLVAWADTQPDCVADSVRLTMLLSSDLQPEDF